MLLYIIDMAVLGLREMQEVTSDVPIIDRHPIRAPGVSFQRHAS